MWKSQMTNPMNDIPEKDGPEQFAELAGQSRSSILGEFWDFLKHNKKWWLLPILLVLVLLGGLLLLAGGLASSGAAPWIYTLF